MAQETIFLTILGMALVTYIPRLFPALALSSRNLSPMLVTWLGYVPAAVLAAMLVPGVLLQDGAIDFSFDNFFLWAAIPTFLLTLKTRSFFGAVLLGMTLVAGGRYFFGM